MINIKRFILRDVKDENESGRTAFILRSICLVMGVYYALYTALFFFTDLKYAFLISLFGIAAYCGIMYLTYDNMTKAALNLFYLLQILWIIICVILMGWDLGVQHFAFVLLLFIFTTSYYSTKIKFLQSCVVYTLRMGLFFYQAHNASVTVVEGTLAVIMQIVNTTAVYILLIIAMSAFASDTLRAEGKLAMANKRLHTLAGTDPLTTLPNRRQILDYIKQCVYRSEKGIGPSLAIGDIDFFKKINDTYGHEAGDEVLKVISVMFKKAMEGHGLCARWGGEEFLFFFERDNLDVAFAVISKIHSALRTTVITFEGIQIRITMTFGMADTVLRKQSDKIIIHDIDAAIREADEKLYMGKESGRDRVIA